MRPLAEKYLNFPEPTAHLTPEVADLLIDTFEKVYKDICDFYNHGELLPVTYKIDPNYDGVAMAGGGVVTLSPKWMESHPWDIDCMTHELIHIAQNYRHHCPGWVCEGIADYGREKHGLYNDKEGWSLPKYNERQKYTDSYRVTAAFFLWIDNNVKSDFVRDLNNAIKAGNYTDTYVKESTGKTYEELWEMYAEASK